MNFLPFHGGLAKGAQAGRRAGRADRRARTARGHGARRAGARRPARAHPLRRCLAAARRRSTARNISAPRRSSPSTTADGMVKARVPAEMPVRAGETVGLALNGAAPVALRQGLGPRHPHQPARRSGPWLTSSSRASPRASATIAAVDGLDLTIKRRRVRRAARPDRRRQDDDAAAHRRAGEAGYRQRSTSAAATRRSWRRPRATSPSCSSNIRSIRI